MNAELEDKVTELSLARDDLHNLMNNTEVAAIFVDNHRRIRRFTEKSKTMVNLIPADIGRPMAHIKTRLGEGDLDKSLEQVLRTLVPHQAEVRTEEGTWYDLRILPYRTADNRIAGAVLTFSPSDEQKKAQEALERLLAEKETDYVLMRRLFDMNRDPLVGRDREGRILVANAPFAQFLGLAVEEVEKNPIFDLQEGRLEETVLGPLLKRAVEEREDFRQEGIRLHSAGERSGYTVTGRIIAGTRDDIYRILVRFEREGEGRERRG